MRRVIAGLWMVGSSSCCMPYMGSAPPCDHEAPLIWCDACSPDHTLCRGAGGLGGNCSHLTRGGAAYRYCDAAHTGDYEARSACEATGLVDGAFTLECRPWSGNEEDTPR